LGALPKNTPHAFAKLQFRFGPRRVPIGKSFLTEVVDRAEDLLKSFDPTGDLVDQDPFGAGSGIVSCACSCHDRVGKILTEGLGTGKKTDDFDKHLGPCRAGRQRTLTIPDRLDGGR
jgi:hypothetical protein